MPAEVGESDEVRVFNPKLNLTDEALLEILEKANLEEAGFEKTVERAIETDENGKTKEKKTIRYMRKVKCSEAAFWVAVLKQRLPHPIWSSSLGSKLRREIQSRIKNRTTKYCRVGFEMLLNPRGHSISDRLIKRAPKSGMSSGHHGCCCCCKIEY